MLSTMRLPGGPIASHLTKGRRKQLQHLCLDRAYISKSAEQEMIKAGFCSTHATQKRDGPEKGRQTKDNILLQRTGGGLWKGQTHGTTGSGNCSQGMKRRLKIILVWCSCHAVSSFTER